MDYGHTLEFGAFITPAAGDPQVPVMLSQVAEAAGLDLVTFQDHPYQPAFLDTWTLMSYVAARTTRIRVTANVLNLPLRPPAVLARAAASLDLLSGGRFELGIGAGGFPDAIASMGGPRLTPGQSIDALAEAIGDHPGPVGHGQPGADQPPGHPLLGGRDETRASAGARHRHLGGRVQAANARLDRRTRRRLAALDGLPAARFAARRQRPDRRGRDRGGPQTR
jgi:alkanesulfonate monooxygenase SsuD/methylene tetrahydromethanopterin reductase-like flavin-dependent oxidoreductase (luciferase family)